MKNLATLLSVVGGFGTFTVTHDITNYTRAVVFERVGKTTNIAIRFSIVSISLGGADTTRYGIQSTVNGMFL
ncbi:hypothetical protein ANN_19302 [Periplaneta americana]|uniref:Catalase core domain-containing protein n=1 Tax=Periplaneta americana TaxID=6978 RepID=A0ABQ8S9Z6_PERAM|nr:hypothetical protein ANN_19302 [Periplaneta americana]